MRSAIRRLQRWHQERRTARAQRRFLSQMELLGIECRQYRREQERGWK